MRKHFIVLFFSTILCVYGLAQNKLTDSLHNLLLTTKEDTSRVLTTIDLGLQYRNTNPDSCVFYCEKALALAKQIRFKRGEAYAITTIGLAMREKGDLPKALELQIQALQIAEPNNYVIEAAFCLRRIGLVYMDINNYPLCLHYLYQALKKQESVQYKRGIAIEYMNLAMTYEYMSHLDSALFYIQKSEEWKHLIEDLYPEVNRVFGNIYVKKGDRQLALAYYTKGIETSLKLNDFRTASFIYADAARMFRQANQPDSAVAYAKKGVMYGQMASYKKGILFSSTMLSELYDSINPEEALRYYKIASAVKDSLVGAGNIQTIQTLIAKEEARQKEVETAKATYRNKLKQYGLLAGLGIFFIVAFILFRNNRQQKKANSLLKQQKEEIQSTLSQLKSTQAQLIQSEKMASLGELTAGIAHEIQNPLNFVNNFSDVNKELVDELKSELTTGNMQQAIEIADDIKANEEKINHHGKRADAIVKGMLQHSRTSRSVKEPTDINSLADEYLRLSYHGLRAKDKNFNATTKTDFDESIGYINIIPQDMGRAILNLINNAFYAVDEKKKKSGNEFEPTVTLSTKKNNSKVEIKVADNGSGIPQKVIDKIFQPFFTTKPTGQGTGLGLSLAYDIVKAHGGELKVKTQEGVGAEFTIQLPTS
jgi:two-component system, NtrC family, sensor kinase